MNTTRQKIKNDGLLRWFLDFWSKDWFLKGVSLALACVLWFLVGGEDTIEKTIKVPVEIINLPRDLVVSNQYKQQIEVSLTGPRSVILDINDKSLTRQVDLSTATPGTLVVKNDVDHIEVPRSLTVQRVQPSSIILSIDKLVQRRYPVVANTVGSVADGFEVQSIQMSPEDIVITGPESVLDQVEELQTSYITINGLQKSEEMQVPLQLSSALVSLIGETSVTAEITVLAKSVVKTVSVPVFLDGVTGGSASPATVSVTAKFPLLLLDSPGVTAESLLHATASYDEKSSRYRVTVVGQDEENLTIDVISVSPSQVDYKAMSAGHKLAHPLLKATPKRKGE